MPPCCASCPEMDPRARTCRLLLEPTPAARVRLATMPCDAGRLLRLRFRGHRDQVTKTAIAAWESSAVGAETVRSAISPPVDARAWTSAWPVLALAGAAIRIGFGPPPQVGEPLPVPTARILVALEALHRIDPTSHLLASDGIRGSVDVGA